MSMGVHTPLSQEWYTAPAKYGNHYYQPRFSPDGKEFGACSCGWKSQRPTRDSWRSWLWHIERVPYTSGEAK